MALTESRFTPKPFMRTAKGRPCPVCGAEDWCSYNQSIAICMRVESNRPQQNGGWLHLLSDQQRSETRYERPKVTVCLPTADRDRRDQVYRALIKILSLSPTHYQHLQIRGMLEGEIHRRQYRSYPVSGRMALAKRIVAMVGEPRGIPGFYRKQDGEWSLAGEAGLFIPVSDHQGRIVGADIRLDRPKEDGTKYRPLSSSWYESGAGQEIVAHVAIPSRLRKPSVVWITEGRLKADIAADRLGLVVLGVPGVASWRSVMEPLDAINPSMVAVAYDADLVVNQAVALQESSLVNELLKRNRVWRTRWDLAYGKGIDDLLVAGNFAQLSVKEASLGNAQAAN